MARKGENIFKRKDGRWEGRYIKARKNGRAVYGYVFGKSYMEAKAKKAEAMSRLSEKQASSTVPAVQPTMVEVSRAWLNDLMPVRKASTIVKYQSQLNTHIMPILGFRKIGDISNDEIILFINDLRKKGLSPKTIGDIHSRLKSIRKYAIIHGYNVGYLPECVSVPQEKDEIRVLSVAEEKVLLAYLNENADLTSLGILICLFTGIRIGELCALTWNEVSLSEQELSVKRTMQRLRNLDATAEKKTYISIDEPKSKCSIRTVPIPDNIMDLIRKAYTSDTYVLTGHEKKFVEPRTMENRFKTILKKCQIEDASFHALRHSYATRCIEAGVDVKVLSEMLGHANVNITLNRYVHPSMSFKHENVKKLSGLFAVK